MISDQIDTAIEALTDGELIAYPTEAVYGLGCDPLNESAVVKLCALKQRSIEQGFILLAGDVSHIKPYIDTSQLSQDQWQRVLAVWPGAVTWVFPAHINTPDWIRGKHDSVAIRVTAHPLAALLANTFGRPIVSTSANVHGQVAARDAQTVDALFPDITVLSGSVSGLKKPTPIKHAVTGLILRS